VEKFNLIKQKVSIFMAEDLVKKRNAKDVKKPL